jgi:hypothetical protein
MDGTGSLQSNVKAPKSTIFMFNFRRIAEKLLRGLRKSPRVIFVRGLQEVHLAALDSLGGWKRIDQNARNRWTTKSAERLQRTNPFAIFAPDCVAAFHEVVSSGALDASRLRSAAAQIAAREFEILGAPIPRTGPWPWRTDWRFGHEWPIAPASSFNHFEARTEPYDVKFPWELGRLQFLVPLLQGAVLDPRTNFIEQAIAILSDWSRDNPYGCSVNWSPMEASMRTIALVMALDMARAAGASAQQQADLLYEIDRNAAFVWRTIEDTDVRGNHYTANLAALLVAGAAIAPLHKQAGRWFRYASARIEPEIVLQYLPDGVNFEKSTYYHRLVTDLFLLMAPLAIRRGGTLGDAARDRLVRACDFVRSYMRPDGTAPVIGDSDDAIVFAMDYLPPHDHRSTLAIGDALLLAHRDDAIPLLPSAVWLFGSSVLSMSKTQRQTQSTWFADGAYAAIHDGTNYFFADLGEVGLAGRGGHGHNDILSFELSVDGVAVIVDPGSYIYTGDFAARDRFRTTAAHNGLMVDGIEIARLGPEPFRISGDAKPAPASMKQKDGAWEIAGGHTGYRRLPDPVVHHRVFRMESALPRLMVEDRLESTGPHKAERFIHFAPGTKIELGEGRASIVINRIRVALRWNGETVAEILSGEVSMSYGQKCPAPVLRLGNAFDGTQMLTLQIERDNAHPLEK